MRSLIILFLLIGSHLSIESQINKIPGIVIQNDFDFDDDSKPVIPFYDNYVLIQCFNEFNRCHQLWLTDGDDANTQKILEVTELEVIKHVQIIGNLAIVFVHSYNGPFTNNGSSIKIYRIENKSIFLDGVHPIDDGIAYNLLDFKIIDDRIYFKEYKKDSFNTNYYRDYYYYNIKHKTVNRILKNTIADLNSPVVWKNELYYFGFIYGTGTMLSKYLANTDTLQMIAILDSGLIQSYQPSLIVRDQNFFYIFIGFNKLNSNGEIHEYLIRSDGTTMGTYKLREISSPFINPENEAIIWNGILYFNGEDPNDSLGGELYISDGSISGTKLFKDLDPGKYEFLPGNFLAFNEKLYFSSIFNFSLNPLLRTDGTPGLIENVDSKLRFVYGPISSMKDTLIFCAEHRSHRFIGYEIYFYNLDGNYRFFDINRSGNSTLYQTIVTPSNIFFTLNDGSGFIHPYVYKRGGIVKNSDEESIDRNILLYPNPVGEYLYFDQKLDLKKISSISIFNENGIEFKIKNWNDNKINIKSLLPGLYRILLFEENKLKYSGSFSKVK